MHWYKFNIGDYRRDTVHLTTIEHGIYRQLLDWYYLEELPIPAETKAVMRRLCLGSDSVVFLENVLRDFFVLGEKGYEQKRVNAEIATYKANAEQYAANGKLGGRPRKTKAVLENNQSITKTKANPVTHKPINPLTNKKTEIPAPPNGVAPEVWQDWLKIRKAKRLPWTDTAWHEIQAEIVKAGLTEDAAIRECCARGWGSFRADWHEKHNGTNGSGETPYQRSMRERVAEFSPGIVRKNPNEAKNVITIEGH